ncbi:SMC-Scp complex subunit ScpB [Actinoplanes sp. G11-F43]|uniref:SMC-Scp complex subunit ScpB n=1 Tax=Actinoplanes sp. G11-F43 TaxID=3424130 RepID=UPI003D34A723
MSTEERPESLAAQAAAWVPPWERRREPDRDYQESVEASAPVVDDIPEMSGGDPVEPEPAAEPGDEIVTVAEPEPEPEPEPVMEAAVPRTPEPVAEIAAVVVPEPAAVDEPAPMGHPLAGAYAPVPAQPRRPRVKVPAVAEVAAPVAVLDDTDLAAALESIMLVVDEPVGELQLAQVLEQPAERIARALEDISARYTAAGHGIDLRRAAGGWRLYTRPEYAAYVERFVLDGQSVRLTQAALETLAVVAYKQPVTRSRISAIRGVNCDGVMRTLVTRGLIEECGTEPETGAYLYRTTPLFLEKLGLNSVDQLPPLAPFLPDDVEEVLDASG